MKRSFGYLALLLGYLLPGFTIVTALALLVSVKVPDLTAGLISIAILILYYFVLLVFRKRAFICAIKNIFC